MNHRRRDDGSLPARAIVLRRKMEGSARQQPLVDFYVALLHLAAAVTAIATATSTLTSAILIEPMLTMFADILRLTHHLLRKLFYKQIIATAGSLPP